MGIFFSDLELLSAIGFFFILGFEWIADFCGALAGIGWFKLDKLS